MSTLPTDYSPEMPGPHGLESSLASTDHARTTKKTRGATFDEHHAPDPELLADCVHCGFCLSSCPTYTLWSEEMDSPRGRIQLMKMVSQNDIGINKTFTTHIDQCLGCMACVTACPSGVQYDKLIETTRSQVERNYPRSLSDRLFRSLIFALFPHPKRLKAMLPFLWLYQKLGLSKQLHKTQIASKLPARLLSMESTLPQVTRARSTRRRRVGLLTGCIQSVFFEPVNAATIRVLTAEGCDVVIPPTQGCCGALSIHSGREDEGLSYARTLIDTFDAWGMDTVIVNAAGCGSSMKEYAYLLRDDPEYAERARVFSDSVRDVSEFLAELAPIAPRHPLPLRIAYHDACHLAHAQGIRVQPRSVLRSIPNLEVLDIPEPDLCCGSAGTYSLLEPVPARQLGDRKAQNIISLDPQCIATANPGCLLQIRSALQRMDKNVPMLHPIELIDASIRGLSLKETLTRGLP
jgi:glycolate oxidase iron-sulfur subunit